MAEERLSTVFSIALRFSLAAMLVFGVGYPMLSVGLAQLLFPAQANGSQLVVDDVIVGSSLVAQPFDAPQYFHPRPSAAGYDLLALAGSNAARSNSALHDRVSSSVASLPQDKQAETDVSDYSDLLTQSGSGIDPHISVAAARLQLPRVAQARGLSTDAVNQLLEASIEPAFLGGLGRERINVLLLNIKMDKIAPGERTP